jgi:hypothetical protein
LVSEVFLRPLAVNRQALDQFAQKVAVTRFQWKPRMVRVEVFKREPKGLTAKRKLRLRDATPADSMIGPRGRSKTPSYSSY